MRDESVCGVDEKSVPSVVASDRNVLDSVERLPPGLRRRYLKGPAHREVDPRHPAE